MDYTLTTFGSCGTDHGRSIPAPRGLASRPHAPVARLYRPAMIPQRMDAYKDLQWSLYRLLACAKDTTGQFLNPYSRIDYRRRLSVHPRCLSALMFSPSSSRLFGPIALGTRQCATHAMLGVQVSYTQIAPKRWKVVLHSSHLRCSHAVLTI